MSKKKAASKSKSKRPAKPKASRSGQGISSVEELIKMMQGHGTETDQELKSIIATLMGADTFGGLPAGSDWANEAQELVRQASGAGPEEVQELCRQALDIDPSCIEAFLLLGEWEDHPSVQAALFKRGMDLGMERFDEAFWEKHAGQFWLIHETRSFLMCMAGYADALFLVGDIRTALATWLTILDANSNDNLGVRQSALLCLAGLGDEESFKEYDGRYKDDNMCGTLFNRALMQHRAGHAANALELLKKANARNHHVMPLLLAAEPPEDQYGLFSIGSQEEALDYARYAWAVFHAMPGAMDLLKQL